MYFRVLGPFEVTRGAQPLPFAPRQRIVLAMLLLEPNRVVAVERLVDAVWDTEPPSTAREQIQICVSSIRRALAAAGAPKMIVTRPPGYSIQCGEDDLDLLSFERLVTRGRREAAALRHAEAVEDFRQALELCRGVPLGGVYSRLAQSVGVGLAERRLGVVEEYVAEQLRLGDTPGLISELVELVAANPFRERLRAQLMASLHRVGRRAEALEVFRAGRELFVEKLGLEPGDELLRVEQAILRGDAENLLGPAAEPPAPARVVPHLLPADLGDFAGRTEPVSWLRRALRAGDDAGARSVRLVAVHGRPWLGKTSLAVHVAHQVCDEFPDGQLFMRLSGSTGPAPDAGKVLGRFLAALGVGAAALPEGTDERAEMYRNLLGDRRMLVVLDDAADAQQVMPLLPGNPACAVIVTSRARLAGLPGATTIGLGAMSGPEAVELLTGMLGPDLAPAEPADLARLAGLCAGEPLALRLAAAKLAARPHWPVSRLVARLSDDRLRLGELSHGGLDLAAAIATVHDRLSGRARLLLHRASLLDSGFAGWRCAPMLGAAEDEADDALAELMDAGLLDVERSADGQVRFHLRGLLRTFARWRLATAESTVGLPAPRGGMAAAGLTAAR